MTYYQQRVLAIRAELYSQTCVCEQVVQAKRFIDRHFADAICLDDVAAAAFLSKFHFLRTFKRYYGQTPYQYLTMVRIAHAKQLLQTGTSVNDVCFQVGFDSLSSFTGLFKKITGSTPSKHKARSLSSCS
ncbi:helix-turn-helix domain-containing protein [Spirosoma koreense]